MNTVRALTACLAIAIPAGAGIIRVDSASTAVSPNGSGWATAFARLQTALTAAVAGDTIWVVRGTYYADSATNRAASFVMKPNVAIYGGFAGSETALAGRNWRANRSVLSGDIGVRGSMTDNAYHVVQGATKGTLDGFTIVKGNANGATDQAYGAGVYCSGTSPIVRNCTFRGGVASMYGGGISATMSAAPAIENCWFDSNSANFGGGCYLNGGVDTVRNCVFTNNSATNGGGMSNGIGSLVVNCVFYHDSATYGGAISLAFNTAVVTQCTFFANRYGLGGGSAISSSFCSPSLANCILWDAGNQELNNGSTPPAITNCCIKGGGTTYGCINTYPVFADSTNPAGPDGVWGTVDDGLALTQASPCVNTGSNGYENSTADVTGGARIIARIVDMGAYEYRGVAKPWIWGSDPMGFNEDDTFNLRAGLLIVLDSNDTYHSLLADTDANYTVLKVNDTLVRIVPKLNFNGQLTVPVRVYDARDTSAVFQARITVYPVSDPPVFVTNLAADTAYAGLQYRLVLQASDPDAGAYHVFSLLQFPAGMQVRGDTLVYTPVPSDSGKHTVSVRVSDGLLYDTLTYDLQVIVLPTYVMPRQARAPRELTLSAGNAGSRSALRIIVGIPESLAGNAAWYRISVYDARGTLVWRTALGAPNPGYYQLTPAGAGSPIATGGYVVRLQGPGKSLQARCTVVR